MLLLLMIVKVPQLCNAGSFYFDSMTRWPRCDDVERDSRPQSLVQLLLIWSMGNCKYEREMAIFFLPTVFVDKISDRGLFYWVT